MLEDYKNLIRSDNLPLVFFEQVKKFKQKPFLWSKKNNSWEGISWEETASQIKRFVNLLKSCGIGKGDKVLISSENRPEWVIADIAIMSIGAIVVPAYTSNTEDDHYYILKHAIKMIILLILFYQNLLLLMVYLSVSFHLSFLLPIILILKNLQTLYKYII